MKFNSMYLCVLLWLSVTIFSVLLAVFRKYEHKKRRRRNIEYINRVLAFLPNCSSSNELLWELYYSYGNNKKLQRLILKALRLQEKQLDDEEYIADGLDFLGKELVSPSIEYLHGKIIEQERAYGELIPNIAMELQKDCKDFVDKWITKIDELFRIMLKKKLMFLIGNISFFIGNLMVFKHNNTVLSEMVLIIVTTISVMLFIILDYDCMVEVSKSRDGNPAWQKEYKKRALSRAQRINNVYQLAGGMGFIVHFTVFVSHWLQQVA